MSNSITTSTRHSSRGLARIVVALGIAVAIFLVVSSMPMPSVYADCSTVCTDNCVVDQAYADDDECGTGDQPFRKFTDAADRVATGGTLQIRPGHYGAAGPLGTATYSKLMTLEAPDGDVVLEPFPLLKGNTACEWGSSNCNRCVPDVVTAFQNIQDHGDMLGYHLGDHPDPDFSVSNCVFGVDGCEHWQGVQRLTADGGRYIVVTRNAIDRYPTTPYHWSGFAVVHMGSRNTTGNAYGSNRSSVNAVPPSDDIVAHTEYIDSWPWDHPGGIQVMGDLLAVGVGDSGVHFYNLANPENPTRVPQKVETQPKSASSTALAQLQDGRYLLVVSATDAHPVDFYISNEPNTISGGFSKFDRWEDPGIGWFAYQSLNLVTECGSGTLYLIGTHNAGTWRGPDPWGADWADLFEIGQVSSYGDGILVRRGKLHAYCDVEDSRQCNYDAAAGIYVSPTGQLAIYSTEHDNDGPNDTVKFMEFWPQSP